MPGGVGASDLLVRVLGHAENAARRRPEVDGVVQPVEEGPLVGWERSEEGTGGFGGGRKGRGEEKETLTSTYTYSKPPTRTEKDLRFPLGDPL